VAQATAYHTARGNAAWTGTDAVEEAALRKAATYLDGEYHRRWKGRKVDPLTQARDWPRYDVIVDDVTVSYPACLDSTTIPQRVKDAQCELALRALTAELAPDTEGKIKRKRIDVIEKEYFPGYGPGEKTYRIVEQLLSGLLKPKGSSDVMRG
jgi:hypothetical protein